MYYGPLADGTFRNVDSSFSAPHHYDLFCFRLVRLGGRVELLEDVGVSGEDYYGWLRHSFSNLACSGYSLLNRLQDRRHIFAHWRLDFGARFQRPLASIRL